MNHITEEEFKQYYRHEMNQTEEMALLTHTCTCDYCAGRLAAAFPEEELITPPANLSEQILASARRMEPRVSRARRQREFYLFSTKVVLAAGLAIVMLFSSGQSGKVLTKSPQSVEQTQGDAKGKKTNVSDSLRKSSRGVGDLLNQFSGKVTEPFTK